MHSVMFDIDGTLVDSFKFDEACFNDAVYAVLGRDVDTDWASYEHITDSGLLMELLKKRSHGENFASVAKAVKSYFLKYIKQHIEHDGVTAVDGAVDFISYLSGREDVSLSIATGGWYESAVLKLEAAGFTLDGISMASANDHHDRVEIMKLAQQRAMATSNSPCFYFGDAKWDKDACSKLGFQFILVGRRISHNLQIENFNNRDSVIEILRLN